MPRIVINILLIIVLIGLVCCGIAIYRSTTADARMDKEIDIIAQQKDLIAQANDERAPIMDFASKKAENSDIAAWLTIPGTVIDYPIMHTSNNDFYLNRDAKKQRNKNGALFLDFRVHPDFSDFNSIIYGHHMASGRMFQNLIKFKNKSFFDSHTTATLYTPQATYKLEIFASAVIPQNSDCYNYAFMSLADKEKHINMIKEAAFFYRDIGVSPQDRIVTLSTCSYEFSNARTVVIARIVP